MWWRLGQRATGEGISQKYTLPTQSTFKRIDLFEGRDIFNNANPTRLFYFESFVSDVLFSQKRLEIESETILSVPH